MYSTASGEGKTGWFDTLVGRDLGGGTREVGVVRSEVGGERRIENSKSEILGEAEASREDADESTGCTVPATPRGTDTRFC